MEGEEAFDDLGVECLLDVGGPGVVVPGVDIVVAVMFVAPAGPPGQRQGKRLVPVHRARQVVRAVDIRALYTSHNIWLNNE